MKSTGKNKPGKGFIIFTLTIALFVICGMAPDKQKNSWADIDPYLEQQMKDWNIPGMAIVVMKGDSVLLRKTMGYSNLTTNKSVTSTTLFSIGSCTKGFTSTSLLLLQDSNKIDLDSPVITYYPELVLSDSLVRNELTVKDILSHRTGFERGDYIWYGSNFSREEILERMKYLEHVAPLRNNFIYNNMMYTLAGTIIEKSSGMKYEDFVQKHLLTPLGMKHTYFGLPQNEANFASPYALIDNKLEQLPLPDLKGVEPAGGIWADLDDMTLWLKFLLSKGRADSVQLLSKASARTLQAPVIFTGGGMRADETEFKSYGLGFGFTAYKGRRVMYHTGVSGGYITHIALMPEENIAIVLMANTETYTNGLINNLFDRTLGTEQTDWTSDVLKFINERRVEDNKERQDALLEIKNRKEIKSANTFGGKYNHPACRDIEIINKDKMLSLKYNNNVYPLVNEKDDVFWAYDEITFGKMGVTFSRNKEGAVTGLTFGLMGEELVFTKAAQ